MSRRSAGGALAGVAVLALGRLLSAGSAGAAEPVGDTFTVFGRDTTTRFPDLAFDPVNQVFLVVSGQLTVTGAFVGRDGAVLGAPFTVAPSPTALSPRVAYHPSAGAFLVTWLDEFSGGSHDVGARLVLTAHEKCTAPAHENRTTALLPFVLPVG